MSDIAIRVENLSKQYRIGGSQVRYKTIRESLTEAVQAPFHRAAKLLRGEPYGAAEMDQTIWALKDVSFEVKEGEVVTRDVPDYALVYGTPATIKGWMCQCGIKLRFHPSASSGRSSGGDGERARCDNCGTAYLKRGQALRPCSGQVVSELN